MILFLKEIEIVDRPALYLFTVLGTDQTVRGPTLRLSTNLKDHSKDYFDMPLQSQ